MMLGFGVELSMDYPNTNVGSMSRMKDLNALLSGIGLGYLFRDVAAAAISAKIQAPSLRPPCQSSSASSMRALMLIMISIPPRRVPQIRGGPKPPPGLALATN